MSNDIRQLIKGPDGKEWNARIELYCRRCKNPTRSHIEQKPGGITALCHKCWIIENRKEVNFEPAAKTFIEASENLMLSWEAVRLRLEEQEFQVIKSVAVQAMFQIDGGMRTVIGAHVDCEAPGLSIEECESLTDELFKATDGIADQGLLTVMVRNPQEASSQKDELQSERHMANEAPESPSGGTNPTLSPNASDMGPQDRKEVLRDADNSK